MRRLVLLAVVISFAIAVPARAEAPVAHTDNLGPTTIGPVLLTPSQRRTRAELIRDTAAAAGMTNAALLGGIGEIETGFAHCWSEATWACQGPSSSSCGGGPVIAGAADGLCSEQKGGLGMFQFDAGTYSTTIATYGSNIVTLQGNVTAVVPFLVTRAIQSVSGIHNEAEALAWMNSIRILDGDPQYEKWLYFVAWRYNGCMGCTTQINKYRSGTNKLRDEFGPGFWTISAPPPSVCAPIPAAGRTIEETDGCFAMTGAASSWQAADQGMGGSCLFTYANDHATADHAGVWTLAFEATGNYRVEVYTDGGALGQSHQASYVVSHAGGTTEVVIDQAAGSGFRSLGVFAFTAGMPFSVSLADNTGEPATAQIAIAFDAVRVVPSDGKADDPTDPTPDAPAPSGCAAGTSGRSGSSGLLVVALGALIGVGRRRRRPR